MKYRAAYGAVIISVVAASAQDWPQWRGANRDARADFKAPKTWPKELKQIWTNPVGEGVATPALVGDKLYTFSRQDGQEVTRCLTVADGKEVWQDKYEALGSDGPARDFSGPRSSPAVAQGKVITLGTRGMLSCLDAASGKKLWRKDDFRSTPGFQVSSSPIIVENLCIAQVGGRDNGALVAYDLATGEEKWKWSGPSPAYASPVLLNTGGRKLIVAHTQSKLVAIDVANGKAAWESAAAPGREGGGRGPGRPGGAEGRPPGADRPPSDGAQERRGGPGGRGGGMGGGMDYRAATPIVDGETIITAGRGIKAFKLEKQGEALVEKELWNNAEQSVQFNTPVLKDNMIYGLAGNNELFCLNARDGKLAWTAPFPGIATTNASAGAASVPPAGDQRPQGAPGTGPGGGRSGRGGGGGRGFGSIVDAGPVLLALNPAGQLVVFEPSSTELKQVATYKVSDKPTHAYPVASGNRIIIKDREAVTLFSVE